MSIIFKYIYIYYMNQLSDKLTLGFMILFMNIGSKHLIKDIPKNIDKIFDYKITRIFVVYCIIYVSTRDHQVALLITLLFILFFNFLLHKESKNYILTK